MWLISQGESFQDNTVDFYIRFCMKSKRFQAKSLGLFSTAQKKYKKDELLKEMMHLKYLPHKSLWIQAIYLSFSQQAVWLQGGKRNYAYVSIKY